MEKLCEFRPFILKCKLCDFERDMTPEEWNNYNLPDGVDPTPHFECQEHGIIEPDIIIQPLIVDGKNILGFPVVQLAFTISKLDIDS